MQCHAVKPFLKQKHIFNQHPLFSKTNIQKGRPLRKVCLFTFHCSISPIQLFSHKISECVIYKIPCKLFSTNSTSCSLFMCPLHFELVQEIHLPFPRHKRCERLDITLNILNYPRRYFKQTLFEILLFGMIFLFPSCN